MRSVGWCAAMAAVLVLALLTRASLLELPPTAHAASTFVVNNSVDEPDAAPGDGSCASVPSGACTLRAAIMEANALAGPDTISLPAGTYAFTVAGQEEQAAARGDLDVASDVTIAGVGAQNTIIDARGLDRVFEVVGGNLALTDVTVQNGSVGSAAGGSNSATAAGGGVAVTSANVSLVIRRSTIANNQSGAFGGGVSAGDFSGHLTGIRLEIEDVTLSSNRSRYGGGIAALYANLVVSRTTVLSNTSTELSGGGLYYVGIAGPGVPPMQATISDSRFAMNVATGSGGAIATDGASVELVRDTLESNQAGAGGAIASGSILTVVSSVIRNNTTRDNGGGIVLYSQFNNPSLTMDDTVVTGNTTGPSGNGGGISAYNGGGMIANYPVTIRRSTIGENVAQRWGGGIQCRCRLDVIDSTIRDNAGSSGGGINVFEGDARIVRSTISGNRTLDAHGGGIDSGLAETFTSSPGSLTIENSTISGNRTLQHGGGIATVTRTTIVNSTIVNNRAELLGGGLFVRGADPKTLTNTIVAANTAPSGRGNCDETITSLGNNLESSNTCGMTASRNDLENVDPRLGPLADNGGPTHTHALLAGSPAIDTAADASCPATDQRGQPRPRDGNGDGSATCDIGSFEAPAANEPPPVVCSPRPPVAVQTARTGDGRLRAAISANGTNNTLTAIRLTRLDNAQIEVAGQAVPTGGITVSLPPGTTSSEILLRPATAGRAAMVSFAVVDRCGEWSSLVGGGPAAF